MHKITVVATFNNKCNPSDIIVNKLVYVKNSYLQQTSTVKKNDQISLFYKLKKNCDEYTTTLERVLLEKSRIYNFLLKTEQIIIINWSYANIDAIKNAIRKNNLQREIIIINPLGFVDFKQLDHIEEKGNGHLLLRNLLSKVVLPGTTISKHVVSKIISEVTTSDALFVPADISRQASFLRTLVKAANRYYGIRLIDYVS